MAIDSSIYRNMASQTPDFMGAIDKGLRMRDLIDQRKEKSAINDAFKKHTSVGPDGKVNVNRELVMKDLYAASPEAASKLSEQFQAQDARDLQMQSAKMKTQMDKLNLSNQLLSAATDQNTWDMSRKKALELGLATENDLPQAFDPKLRDYLAGATMTQMDRLNEQFRRDQLQSSAADRREARADRLSREKVAADEKMHGLQTPFGLANTPDDAKQLKEAFEAKKNFDSKLNEMIALRKQYGGETLNREAVARGKQLSKDLLLEYKNMAKLGVLSQSDEKIINAIIPDDPLAYSVAGLFGQDPILSNLEKFKADKDNDFETRVGTRTRSGIRNIAERERASSSKPLMTPQNRSINILPNANASGAQVFKTSDIEWAD